MPGLPGLRQKDTEKLQEYADKSIREMAEGTYRLSNEPESTHDMALILRGLQAMQESGREPLIAIIREVAGEYPHAAAIYHAMTMLDVVTASTPKLPAKRAQAIQDTWAEVPETLRGITQQVLAQALVQHVYEVPTGMNDRIQAAMNRLVTSLLGPAGLHIPAEIVKSAVERHCSVHDLPANAEHLAVLDQPLYSTDQIRQAMGISVNRPDSASPSETAAVALPQPGAYRLLDHGSAPYQFNKDEAKSYFVKMLNHNGEEKTVWGVDLERALTESGADKGDLIDLKNLGKETVNVKIVDENGQETWKPTYRNTFAIEVVPPKDNPQDTPSAIPPEANDGDIPPPMSDEEWQSLNAQTPESAMAKPGAAPEKAPILPMPDPQKEPPLFSLPHAEPAQEHSRAGPPQLPRPSSPPPASAQQNNPQQGQPGGTQITGNQNVTVKQGLLSGLANMVGNIGSGAAANRAARVEASKEARAQRNAEREAMSAFQDARDHIRHMDGRARAFNDLGPVKDLQAALETDRQDVLQKISQGADESLEWQAFAKTRDEAWAWFFQKHPDYQSALRRMESDAELLANDLTGALAALPALGLRGKIYEEALDRDMSKLKESVAGLPASTPGGKTLYERISNLWEHVKAAIARILGLNAGTAEVAASQSPDAQPTTAPAAATAQRHFKP